MKDIMEFITYLVMFSLAWGLSMLVYIEVKKLEKSIVLPGIVSVVSICYLLAYYL